jgi:hypothetical protein
MSKTTYGLFDNQKELEGAVQKLQEIGVEQIRVVDEARLGNKIKLVLSSAAVQSPVGASTSGAMPAFATSADDPGSSIASYLKDLDIAEAEARFYARAINQGGSLIIVDATDGESVRVVQQIMRQANAVQVS